MIVFIAPYSAATRGSNRNLGATRKIEFFLAMAARMTNNVVLVNSLHENSKWAPREVRECQVGNLRIREIALRSYPVRIVGKFLNLLEADAVSREISQFGRPDAVWIYNAYAFEALLARALTRDFGARLIFQFDDWLLARRCLHPKPFIDFLAWRYALPAPSVCMAVNDHLAAREKKRSGRPIMLCPGVVSDELLAACARRQPFEGPAGRQIVVGYFGGLWPEKGADLVLELVRRSNGRFLFHVCGNGPLAEGFERLSHQSDNVRFHGHVDEATLFRLIAECDVLVNVHASIEKMGNGIFPFKVVEYVASGRLVISTDLPALSMRDVREAVHFVPARVESIMDALADAESLYASKRREIQTAMSATREALSATAFEQALAPMLGHARPSANEVIETVASGEAGQNREEHRHA